MWAWCSDIRCGGTSGSAENTLVVPRHCGTSEWRRGLQAGTLHRR